MVTLEPKPGPASLALTSWVPAPVPLPVGPVPRVPMPVGPERSVPMPVGPVPTGWDGMDVTSGWSWVVEDGGVTGWAGWAGWANTDSDSWDVTVFVGNWYPNDYRDVHYRGGEWGPQTAGCWCFVLWRTDADTSRNYLDVLRTVFSRIDEFRLFLVASLRQYETVIYFPLKLANNSETQPLHSPKAWGHR